MLSLVHVRPLRIHVRPPPVRARCVPLRLERPQVARHRPVPAVRVLAGSQSALPRHVAARPLDVKDAGGAGARDPAYEDASDTPGLMQKPQSMGTTHILPAHQAKVKTIGPTESHEREDVFVSRGTDPNSLPRFRERLSASAACLPRSDVPHRPERRSQLRRFHLRTSLGGSCAPVPTLRASTVRRKFPTTGHKRQQPSRRSRGTLARARSGGMWVPQHSCFPKPVAKPSHELVPDSITTRPLIRTR